MIGAPCQIPCKLSAPLLFTGETVHPWHFRTDPALRPLRDTAHALAQTTEWTPLYDPGVLAANQVPTTAVVYQDDLGPAAIPRERHVRRHTGVTPPPRLPETAPSRDGPPQKGSTVSRSARRIAAALLAAAALGAALVLPAATASASTCWYGSCFSYVSGQQEVNTVGASITMAQAAPRVYGGHSLQELALRTDDRSAIVEVGWMVDPATNGDYQPHLFVYHWVDNQTSCYNGCGFVPISNTVTAGMTVASGTTAKFTIYQYYGDWYLYYNDVAFGYFPGALWGGAFTAAQNVSAFGEVADSGQTSCNAMGDGRYGSSPGSTSISNYELYGSDAAPYFSVSATDPAYYNYGAVTPTSFRLGGPGAC